MHARTFKIEKWKKTDLSLWNLRLCTTCGIFCRKFHRCRVSSAVAETNAPSLIRNCNCITAVHPSCFTCASTPGRPKLFFNILIKENTRNIRFYNPNSVHLAIRNLIKIMKEQYIFRWIFLIVIVKVSA